MAEFNLELLIGSGLKYKAQALKLAFVSSGS